MPSNPSGESETRVALPFGFGVHWLKLTLFVGLEEAQSFVEWSALDTLNMGLPLRWVERGPADRWASVLWWGEGADGTGGKAVLRSPKKALQTYTIFELTGEGCEALGLEGLSAFLGFLQRQQFRWHGKRIDCKWDGVPFTPQVLDAAARGGLLVSRGLKPGDVHTYRDGEGFWTTYLGLRKQHKKRMVRCYDCRGYTRIENELHDEEADDCVLSLASSPLEQWSQTALGYLLRTADFKELGDDTRTNRAPRPEWWASFVGAAEKVQELSLTQPHRPQELTPLGRANLLIQRSARALLPILEAMGKDWLIGQIRAFGEPALRDADRAFVEALKDWRGFAGVEEPIPF